MIVAFVSLALTSLTLITDTSLFIWPMVGYYLFMSLWMLTGRAENVFKNMVQCENDRRNFVFFTLCVVFAPALALCWLMRETPWLAVLNLVAIFPHAFFLDKTKKLLADQAESFYSAATR